MPSSSEFTFVEYEIPITPHKAFRPKTRRDPWDAHGDIFTHRKNARDPDQPYAAVIKYLKARGLLDKTLVVIGSEFGGTPVLETGGGGADDFGFKSIDSPCHIHDLHATILHLMGIERTKLTYNHSGRDFRLTDVHGHLIKDMLV